ncbi:hypothetical protein B0H14DRAFT_2556800 [Mycena olivaceomarginata]|nr:hypothetical protein B0H14DRAFT_2556800 [Mycena olivaceomarginata]
MRWTATIISTSTTLSEDSGSFYCILRKLRKNSTDFTDSSRPKADSSRATFIDSTPTRLDFGVAATLVWEEDMTYVLGKFVPANVIRHEDKIQAVIRFDSVIYEDKNSPLAMGELHFLFRCHLPGDAAIDLVIIRPFRTTAWKPNTYTDCLIRKNLPLNNCHFIALEHVRRSGKENQPHLPSAVSGGMEGVGTRMTAFKRLGTTSNSLCHAFKALPSRPKVPCLTMPLHADWDFSDIGMVVVVEEREVKKQNAPSPESG